MQRAQVFLRDDQKQSLRTIAARTGRKQSDIIRRGVDLIIEKEQKRVHDWKKALQQARGMWKDRDDLNDLRTEIRQGLNLLMGLI
jgi:predicted transcriptional regulator